MTVKEYLKQIDEVNEKGKYKANWQTLSNHKTPDWYYKGKLGIFIHWGNYSVPGFGNEWYSREMYDPKEKAYKHHIENFASTVITTILSVMFLFSVTKKSNVLTEQEQALKSLLKTHQKVICHFALRLR